MRLVACGDSLFSSSDLAERIDPAVVRELREADACFSNAEFCTPKRDTPPASGRGYMTAVREDALDEFTALNIRLLSLVNNHSGDYGWQGIVDTMEAVQKRKLVGCGVGYNLKEARLPRFLDTKAGRVGVVAAASTRSEVFLAADEGARSAARPGTNPLRWGRKYVLPRKEYDQLRAIDELLGTARSAREGTEVETWTPPADGNFPFGSMFEGHLDIRLGECAGVWTFLNETDMREIEKSIRDASRRSDLALFSLHTHEGKNENWYAPEPPEFVEQACRRAVDAGADAVIGHGAHFMRGIEIYKGKPIFYNLGSLLMEFEAGESVITPEMYEAYGYGPDARPSDLHGNRVKDKDGRFIGFASERRFSENAIARLEKKDGRISWGLIPLDLHLDDERPLRRGLPTIADEDTAVELTAYLNRVSAPYGTRLKLEDGMIVPE